MSYIDIPRDLSFIDVAVELVSVIQPYSSRFSKKKFNKEISIWYFMVKKEIDWLNILILLFLDINYWFLPCRSKL